MELVLGFGNQPGSLPRCPSQTTDSRGGWRTRLRGRPWYASTPWPVKRVSRSVRARGWTYVGCPSRRRHGRKSAECDRRRIGSAAAPSMEILNGVDSRVATVGDLDESLLRMGPRLQSRDSTSPSKLIANPNPIDKPEDIECDNWTHFGVLEV